MRILGWIEDCIFEAYVVGHIRDAEQRSSSCAASERMTECSLLICQTLHYTLRADLDSESSCGYHLNLWCRS